MLPIEKVFGTETLSDDRELAGRRETPDMLAAPVGNTGPANRSRVCILHRLEVFLQLPVRR
jgi:hypothetical protein